jgi:RimJ/RimL family protein N-acetyltransferase
MSGLLPEATPGGLNYGVYLQSPVTSETSGIIAESAIPATSHSSRMVGIVGTFRSPPSDNKVAEAGYIFHPEAWGRGYATEALRQFLELFWEEKKDLSVVEAITTLDNNASQRVLEKCGFVESGKFEEKGVALLKFRLGRPGPGGT